MKSAQAAALSLALILAPPALAQGPQQSAAGPTGLWGAAVSLVSEATNILLTPVRSAWAAVSEAVFGVENAVASSVAHFTQTLRSDFSRFEDLVGRAGFRITAIDVKPGIIPEIELAFEAVEIRSEADEQKLKAALDQLGGTFGAIERAIIIGLLDADEAVESIRPDGFHISEIRMALVAIFPEITVSFSRDE